MMASGMTHHLNRFSKPLVKRKHKNADLWLNKSFSQIEIDWDNGPTLIGTIRKPTGEVRRLRHYKLVEKKLILQAEPRLPEADKNRM